MRLIKGEDEQFKATGSAIFIAGVYWIFCFANLRKEDIMSKKFLYFLVGLAFALGALNPALGEEFYKGKKIRIIVGSTPGGGFDTYARLIARHLGKYIPGHPSVLVQNMPGGGMLIAANYIYNRAKPDGLTIGHWTGALTLQHVMGNKAAG